ncbi:hypothetical protein MKW98_003101 [Papaver atlanticum]|uniref:Uncharacterized protein n=1 Tax=Papaver atlanticum TaxID=357466 RepID=A0AAD4TI36_9MAGN|nr:hypothetical protein MKW98_003101 [Papaver atlanticum]
MHVAPSTPKKVRVGGSMGSRNKNPKVCRSYKMDKGVSQEITLEGLLKFPNNRECVDCKSKFKTGIMDSDVNDLARDLASTHRAS